MHSNWTVQAWFGWDTKKWHPQWARMEKTHLQIELTIWAIANRIFRSIKHHSRLPFSIQFDRFGIWYCYNIPWQFQIQNSPSSRILYSIVCYCCCCMLCCIHLFFFSHITALPSKFFFVRFFYGFCKGFCAFPPNLVHFRFLQLILPSLACFSFFRSKNIQFRQKTIDLH